MKEMFVIYNKDTGFIDGGIGFIDKEWDKANADESTATESIKRILKKNPKREVIYLPMQEIPEPDTVKVKGGMLVPLDEGEETPGMIRVKNRRIIDAEIRKMAIDKLKLEWKLPIEYSE